MLIFIAALLILILITLLGGKEFVLKIIALFLLVTAWAAITFLIVFALSYSQPDVAKHWQIWPISAVLSVLLIVFLTRPIKTRQSAPETLSKSNEQDSFLEEAKKSADNLKGPQSRL
jgi:uncharacterized membrane protein